MGGACRARRQDFRLGRFIIHNDVAGGEGVRVGEEPEEVAQALRDLREAGTDIITITQYLRPSPRHLPVARWVKPEEFLAFKTEAERIGFLGVLAGPLVRSSYRAGRLWAQSMRSMGRDLPRHLAHIGEEAGANRFAQAV